MVRKTIASTVALALALTLAACGGGGDDEGSGNGEVADITAKALALDDLPTGWAEDNSEDDDGDSPAFDCLEDVEGFVADKTGEAEVSFVKGTTVPQLNQLLVEMKSPAAAATAIATLDGALDDCGAFEFEDGGDTVKGQVAKVSLPDVAGADEQVNYQLTAESDGFGLSAGILVASKGTFLTMLMLLDIGSFDADQLVELAELAVGKLTSDGAPEASGGSTTTDAPVEPSTAPSLTIAGTVTIPEGEEGELSIVLTGPMDDEYDDEGAVPVVVRNRTTDTVYSLDVSGTARSGDGTLAGSGSSDGSFVPERVEPGEWAFGYVYFEGSVPPNAEFDLTVTGDEESSGVDATITEHNVVADESGSTVVGIVANESDEELVSVTMSVMCFDEAGTAPVSTNISYVDSDSVAPDGTAPFTISLPDDDACTNFALAATGY